MVDGAVLLDLSLMRGVFVDPHKRTAAVEGEQSWHAYNRKARKAFRTVKGMSK